MLTIYVCKVCGRAIKSETKPNFCYFDRTSSIENIGEEDAVKMGLFSQSKGLQATFSDEPNWTVTFEFPGDYKYHPFTGEKAPGILLGDKLTEFQETIMQKVIA